MFIQKISCNKKLKFPSLNLLSICSFRGETMLVFFSELFLFNPEQKFASKNIGTWIRQTKTDRNNFIPIIVMEMPIMIILIVFQKDSYVILVMECCLHIDLFIIFFNVTNWFDVSFIVYQYHKQFVHTGMPPQILKGTVLVATT